MTACSRGMQSRHRSWHEMKTSSRSASTASSSLTTAGSAQRSMHKSTWICWNPARPKVLVRTSSKSVFSASLATWASIPLRVALPSALLLKAPNEIFRAKMRWRSLVMESLEPCRLRCCTNCMAEESAGKGPCGSTGLATSPEYSCAARRCICRSSERIPCTSSVTARGVGRSTQSVRCTLADTRAESCCACISTKRCSSVSRALPIARCIAPWSKPSAAPPRPWGASCAFSSAGTCATPAEAMCMHSPARSKTARPLSTGSRAKRDSACNDAKSPSTRCLAIPLARRLSKSQSGTRRGAVSESAL
mmetsp:Transcript_55398/g.127330  ORF Transcript_55398/g.127330 Transcript_55398/m.127330 type:complete len:306 (-) Transcript_55398:1481-2398(-)